MKDGLRVFDADTHVEPSAEVLDKYVDPGFRSRLPDLAAYRFPARANTPGGAPDRHLYRYGQIAFKRILGGATSVIEGLGSLRNKIGDAHGHAKKAVRPSARHAQLAVNLAGTMATFIVETWNERKG